MDLTLELRPLQYTTFFYDELLSAITALIGLHKPIPSSFADNDENCEVKELLALADVLMYQISYQERWLFISLIYCERLTEKPARMQKPAEMKQFFIIYQA
ncbi:unnamed protein product [Blepharisma stoltei]|uniref:Uncharacterized protein n=1 Tax=Blepharisma stoltei TaxID=1481888 RepID=A0AAU9JPV5_9CILI|nr:unnamed protein product [Blepharisma stoltei]